MLAVEVRRIRKDRSREVNIGKPVSILRRDFANDARRGTHRGSPQVRSFFHATIFQSQLSQKIVISGWNKSFAVWLDVLQIGFCDRLEEAHQLQQSMFLFDDAVHGLLK